MRSEMAFAIGVACLLSFAMGLILDAIFAPTLLGASMIEPACAGGSEVLECSATRSAIATEIGAFWTRVDAMLGVFSGVAAFFAFKAFKEAQRAADAAVDANQINQSATSSQLRAYLSVETPLLAYDEQQKMIQFSFVIKNRGMTPARQVSLYCASYLGRIHPSKKKYHDDTFLLGTYNLIAPGQEKWADLEFSGNEKGAVLEIEEGKRHFGAGLLVSYFDIYGKQHRIIERLGFSNDSLLNGKPRKVASVAPPKKRVRQTTSN